MGVVTVCTTALLSVLPLAVCRVFVAASLCVCVPGIGFVALCGGAGMWLPLARVWLREDL